MIGADAERLVSILLDKTRGSGYLLAPNLVLTAGHCVESEGSEVEVLRFSRDEHGRYDLAASSAFKVAVKSGPNALDFALLTHEGPTSDPLALGGKGRGEVRLGRLVGEDQVPAQALGFPTSQVDTQQYMNVEDARGFVLPLTGSRTAQDAEAPTERLHFQISTGTPVRSVAASLWGGMSGAALFSGDHLLGVIVEDRPTVEGRLQAVPVERIFGERGHEEAKACLRRHQTRRIDDSLTDPVWAGHGVLKPPYSPLPPPDQWSEADLLQARYNVVPFCGDERKRERDQLTDWCRTSGKIRMRLLSGGGAVGKSRLAREVCRLMGAEGWVVGIIDPLSVDFAQVCALDENRLLVVDDADAHVGQLEALLTEVDRQAERPHRLRILVVGHSGGPWWQALRRRHESRMDSGDPPPLTPPAHIGRKEVYDAAVEAFRLWYQQKDLWYQQKAQEDTTETEKKAAPTSKEGPTDTTGACPLLDFSSRDFDSYLLILIQALVDARARLDKGPAIATAPALRSRVDALLDYAIDVERQRWQESARSSGLPDDAVLLERVIAIAGMAVATGPTDGSGETDASRRLRLVPDLADEPEWRRRAFARWQHTQFTGEGYLRPLQPLRLAERLGARVLATFPELVSQLLDVEGTGPGIPDRPVDQSHQVLNVLQLLQLTAGNETENHDTCGDIAGTSSQAQKDARGVLEHALRAHATALLRLVKKVAMNDEDGTAQAIGASLAVALNTTLQKGAAQAVAAEVLTELDESCPDVLLELATTIADHAVAYYQRSDSPHTEENRAGLATALQRWSLYLANSGLRNRACDVAYEAVYTHHALAQQAPSPEHKLGLAEAHSDLADRLDDVGRFEEAHDHAREAVRLFDELHQQSPPQVDSFRLAKALCTHATAANDIGRHREALQAAIRACKLTQQLPRATEVEEDDIKGKQAFALRGLAWQLGKSGVKDEALTTAKDACAKYRDLFGRNPGHWRRHYALALSICGSQHEAKEEWNDSIELHKEAVDTHYKTLEQQYREAVRPHHANALRHLAAGHLGRARHQLPQVSTPESLMPSEQAMADLEADLDDARDRIDQALTLYKSMRPDDRLANRLSEASAHRLRAEILVTQGNIDEASARRLKAENLATRGNIDKRFHPARPSRAFKPAEAAAKDSLKLYEAIDKHTWQSKFDMIQARVSLVEATAGQGRSKEARGLGEDVRSCLLRLGAEEPDRTEVDDALGLIEKYLEGLSGLSEPPQKSRKPAKLILHPRNQNARATSRTPHIRHGNYYQG
ncbi:trypsin-like peptidase domain-containing protein [Streptomyces sp. NPDC060028]|uniref:trypsin-like peptidase domain-containing protein n=1 Tax=Streptomyces sp. NPDC060028 TaxID=3347041 RepID=UPI00369508EB